MKRSFFCRLISTRAAASTVCSRITRRLQAASQTADRGGGGGGCGSGSGSGFCCVITTATTTTTTTTATTTARAASLPSSYPFLHVHRPVGQYSLSKRITAPQKSPAASGGYSYNFSSVSAPASSLAAGGGAAAGGAGSKLQDHQNVGYEDDDDDDYHEVNDDDDDNKGDSYVLARWYENLRRYEKQLLLEQQQQQQQKEQQEQLLHEEELEEEERIGTKRLFCSFLRVRATTTRDASLIRWIKINRRKYRHGMLSPEQQDALQKTLQSVLRRASQNSGNNNNNNSSSSSGGENETAAAAVVGESSTDAATTNTAAAATRFLLEPRLEYWREMYQQLGTFVQEHDGKFPYDYTAQQLASLAEKRLLYWCQRQRKDYKAHLHQQEQDKQQQQQQDKEQEQQSDLSNNSSGNSNRIMMQDRIEKLEALGFVWDEHDQAWHERYQELKEYRQHHGHCAIPTDYPDNVALSKWVSDQRTNYRRYCHRQQEQQQQQAQHPMTMDADTTTSTRSTMTPERLVLLQEIDFCWNALDAKWMRRYRELQEYLENPPLTVCNNNNKGARRSSNSSSRGNRLDQDASSGVVMIQPRLPARPLKRWLVFQKKQYKQYLEDTQSSATSCTTTTNNNSDNNTNHPPQRSQQKQHHEHKEDFDDDDDQKILATQLTLEKRFQLLQKLGFPWE
jgi:hypothetical protein